MPEKAQPQIVIVNITPLIAVNLIGQLNLLRSSRSCMEGN